MLYGYTPFRGKTRQKTFANILHKDLKFPRSKSVSSLFLTSCSIDVQKGGKKKKCPTTSVTVSLFLLQVSLQGKLLMYRLLHRDPKNRLGPHEGAEEIKRHPFFWRSQLGSSSLHGNHLLFHFCEGKHRSDHDMLKINPHFYRKAKI